MQIPEPEPPGPARPLVLDTNILLDLWVFADVATEPLLGAIHHHQVQWIATQAMRDELERVLHYPQIAKRLLAVKRTSADVLAQFDANVQMHPAPGKAIFSCKDPDDQKFIDLAVAHQAQLLSKDQAVLCMARRLKTLGVEVRAAFAAGEAPSFS